MDIRCICPPKAGVVRHPAGDTVELRERLDFRSALIARNTIVLLKQEDEDVSSAEILASLTEVYLVAGIRTWSLVDERGKPVEVSKATIRKLMDEHPDVAMDLGDAADELYSEAVILPLVTRAQNSSLSTPTSASTSATTGSSRAPRKPLKRSSTTTTPMAGTGMMQASPAGGSSSSQS